MFLTASLFCHERGKPPPWAAPQKGNEEWTEDLAATGAVKLKKEWHPWFTKEVPSMPAGCENQHNPTV